MKLFMLYITSTLLLTHSTTQTSLAKPGCQERCGNITIPYPYGIGAGCYLHKSFEVMCNMSSEDGVPLRFVHNLEYPIIEISMESVRVISKPAITCNDSGIMPVAKTVGLDTYFSYSYHQNMYTAIGCGITATFQAADTFSGIRVECSSICEMTPSGTCFGIEGCCQRNVPTETRAYTVQINYLNTFKNCYGAFMVAKDHQYRPFFYDWKHNYSFPVVLNWVIGLGTCHQSLEKGESLCGHNTYCADTTMGPAGPGYKCRCMEGYKGNPYLPSGCKGIKRSSRRKLHSFGHTGTIIATVVGLLFCSIVVYLVFFKLAERKKNKIHSKNFMRNGGHLLKQHISANRSCVLKLKIYAAEEIEKAAGGFSRKQLLGKGGQGTVYRGLLSDGTVVAIKKSNAVQEIKVEEFLNELLILAQINHRNIVKLIGCCLEYEVPLLVYECLSNGTLSEHLHDGAEVSKFSWKERIRIAKEVAGALAYLHSYASVTIFHRDIKPLNILLDEKYRAVLSDFGLSRSMSISKTHLTTQVEGTFGYLDPEYFHSGQFTAKSDVYAFGVILTELLTRRKSVSVVDNSDEGLIPRFQYLMKHNRVFEILDKQVVKEAWTHDVVFVAKLSKRCMKRNAKKRPNMIEVVADLDKLMLVQPDVSDKGVPYKQLQNVEEPALTIGAELQCK